VNNGRSNRYERNVVHADKVQASPGHDQATRLSAHLDTAPSYSIEHSALQAQQSFPRPRYSGPAAMTVDQRTALHSCKGKFFINCVFDLRDSMSVEVAQRTMEHVVLCHDALRARFEFAHGTWRQQISADADQRMIFTERLAFAWSAPEIAAQLSGVLERLQGNISVTNGPLACAAIVEDSEGVQKLLVTLSHFIADGISLTIVMEDFFKTYEEFSAGVEPSLRNTLPIDLWAPKYSALTSSDAFCSQIDRWEALPWHEQAALPLDFPENDTPELNVCASSYGVIERFELAETKAIQAQVPRYLRISTTDFLTIALVRVLMRWSGGKAGAVQVHDPGRKMLGQLLGLNFSRTVAAISSRRCVVLKGSLAGEELRELAHMQAQMESLPLKGAGLLMLQHACEREDIAARAHALPAPQVWFNYFGGFDALMGRHADDSHNTIALSKYREYIPVVSNSPMDSRNRTFMVVGQIKGGSLHLLWEYSTNLHTHATVCRLAADYKREILRFLDLLPALAKESRNVAKRTRQSLAG
jgi:non-ribosomal peptide synthase protein (TIGR01720 family)